MRSGRPSKNFEALSDRSKRRKEEIIAIPKGKVKYICCFRLKATKLGSTAEDSSEDELSFNKDSELSSEELFSDAEFSSE
ncbi:hypothetical protein QE152_g32170 [Popillia japonica]|uniref:Uncharacterized protein n=1 Tax=Popillia japonica TaxID=7064 RepID=A0AAW1IZK1_POPJA